MREDPRVSVFAVGLKARLLLRCGRAWRRCSIWNKLGMMFLWNIQGELRTAGSLVLSTGSRLKMHQWTQQSGWGGPGEVLKNTD